MCRDGGWMGVGSAENSILAPVMGAPGEGGGALFN